MNKNKKNTILFLAIVVLCLTVVIVMNIVLNISEQTQPAAPKYQPPAREPIQQQEAQPVTTQEPPPAQPEYEATVSNGTILF